MKNIYIALLVFTMFSFQKNDQMRRFALMLRSRTRQSEERPIHEEFRFDDTNPPQPK